MRGYNKVMLIGNLGADPDTRYIPDGTAVTNFNIAVSETYKDKTTGEQKEATEWVLIETWGRTAEVCAEYLTKGKPVFVEGQLKTDQWEDKDTGQKRYRTKVRALNVQMLGARPERGPAPPRNEQPGQQDEFDDDIPF